MGIRDAIAERWAHFRAYLHSIPPHVWVGLIIGAIALVLAYLAWRNRNEGLSDLSPIGDIGTTSPIPSPPSLPAPPPILAPGPGGINLPTAPPPFVWGNPPNPSTPHPAPSPILVTGPIKFNKQIGYDIHAAGQAASQLQSASAPQHGYDIHAASTNLDAIRHEQAVAIQNFRQSEIASWTTPLVKPPSDNMAIQNFRQSEIASWTTPLVKPPAAKPIVRPPTAYTPPSPTKAPTQRGTNISF